MVVSVCSLLNIGAVPNLISTKFAEKVDAHVEKSSKSIRVANGDVVDRVGVVKNVPVVFDDITVPLDFIVLNNTVHEVLIGMHTLSVIRERFDFVKQEFSMSHDGASATLALEYFAPF